VYAAVHELIGMRTTFVSSKIKKYIDRGVLEKEIVSCLYCMCAFSCNTVEICVFLYLVFALRTSTYPSIVFHQNIFEVRSVLTRTQISVYLVLDCTGNSLKEL